MSAISCERSATGASGAFKRSTSRHLWQRLQSCDLAVRFHDSSPPNFQSHRASLLRMSAITREQLHGMSTEELRFFCLIGARKMNTADRRISIF